MHCFGVLTPCCFVVFVVIGMAMYSAFYINLVMPKQHINLKGIKVAYKSRIFIVTTGSPSERRFQKTVSCYGGMVQGYRTKLLMVPPGYLTCSSNSTVTRNLSIKSHPKDRNCSVGQPRDQTYNYWFSSRVLYELIHGG